MKIKTIFSVAALLCLLTGCGNDNMDFPSEENIMTTTDILTSKTDMQSTSEIISEEPQINDITNTQKEFSFYRDHMKIYGRIFLPDGDGIFPCVIISSDLGREYKAYEAYASAFASEGVVSVIFDCTGAVVPSNSGGKVIDMTAQTEKADILTVVSNIMDMPQINSKGIFLMGDGFGCNTAIYAAAEKPDMIKGVILAEPAFDFSDNLKQLFPDGTEIPSLLEDPFYIGKDFITEQLSSDIFELMPRFKKNVLIMSDAADENKLKYSEKAHVSFPSAILMSVKDLNGNVSRTKNQKVIDETLRFVKANKS